MQFGTAGANANVEQRSVQTMTNAPSRRMFVIQVLLLTAQTWTELSSIQVHANVMQENSAQPTHIAPSVHGVLRHISARAPHILRVSTQTGQLPTQRHVPADICQIVFLVVIREW